MASFKPHPQDRSPSAGDMALLPSIVLCCAFVALTSVACGGMATPDAHPPRSSAPASATAGAHPTMAVKLDGLREVAEADLRAALARDEIWTSRDFPAEAAMDRAEAIVREALHDRGYIESRVESFRAEGDPRTITFHVEEGPRYRVAKLQVRESDGGPPRLKPLPPLSVAAHDWFSRRRLREDVATLVHAYADAGYGLAIGEPLWKVHPETREVDLAIEISPGKRYDFGDIRVVPKTFEGVILERARREGIAPGVAYHESKVDQVRGTFPEGTINVVRQESSGGDRIDLLFEVRQ